MKRDLPNLFAYDDYRLYLADWMAASDKSWRWFAKRAGFKSHNAVALVVAGKRNLSLEGAEKCATALGHSREQALFFSELVRLNQATEPRERMASYARVVAHPKRRKVAPLDATKLTFFSNWLAPVVFEMVQFPDFQADARWISERFDPPLPLQAVKEVMRELVSSGLVEEDAKGRWRCRNEHLSTGDQVGDIHLYAYHETALAKAADALHEVHDSRRHYHVITTAAPAAVMPKLIELSREFEEKLLAAVEAAAGQKDDVFQIGIQIFTALNTPKKKMK